MNVGKGISETAIDRRIEELIEKRLNGDQSPEIGSEIAKLQAARRDRLLQFRGSKVTRPRRISTRLATLNQRVGA